MPKAFKSVSYAAKLDMVSTSTVFPAALAIPAISFSGFISPLVVSLCTSMTVLMSGSSSSFFCTAFGSIAVHMSKDRTVYFFPAISACLIIRLPYAPFSTISSFSSSRQKVWIIASTAYEPLP